MFRTSSIIMNPDASETKFYLHKGYDNWPMDGDYSEKSTVENVLPDYILLTQLPERSLILYKVAFVLHDNTELLCTFSRAFIDDIDLFNLCLVGTNDAHIVPTEETVKLLEEWVANKWDLNSEDSRQSSLSESLNSSLEEEQELMQQMGLPVKFGESREKKNDLERFFNLISKFGHYSGLDCLSESSNLLGKTLKLSEIRKLKYLYCSEQFVKTPRYRFVNQLNSKKVPMMEKIVNDPTINSATICHSATSSRSNSSESEDSTEANLIPPVTMISFTKNDLKFDFSFDPVRDASLVAKNFQEEFSGDTEIKKYWFQRFRLFSKLNDGILMDRESWFSVTPERVARHIARRMVRCKGTVIMDAFTGAGGNAIQFARQGAFVYAIDLDPIKIRCARRNAEVYGVLDRITFICGDFFKVAKSFIASRKHKADALPSPNESPYGIDAVFLSPPWGGPSYEAKIFDIQNSMGGLDGIEIFRLTEKLSANIGYFLPRNTPSCQIIALASNFHHVEIEQSLLNGKNKAITAFYGNLVASQSSNSAV